MELVSDGGKQFVSVEFESFLKRWNVKHHICSAYNPHSNLLAESCVKNMKRLIRDNVDGKGSLDTDFLTQTLLTYCNTPLRGLGTSPAMILFNRKLRYVIPGVPGAFLLRPEWEKTLDNREIALAQKHIIGMEKWSN